MVPRRKQSLEEEKQSQKRRGVGREGESEDWERVGWDLKKHRQDKVHCWEDWAERRTGAKCHSVL